MDRFSLETYNHSAAAAHAQRVWGDTPMPSYDNPCCDCRQDVPELIDVPGYGKCCPGCAPAAIAFMAAPQPVEAAVLSACCGAEMRIELYSHGTCPETGYHDDGEMLVCLGCGNETEEEVRPATRKPAAIAKMQGDLFNQGVA